MQVRQLQLEFAGTTVPFSVPFPDLTDEEVPTAHAIALTHDRIMTSFFRTRAPMDDSLFVFTPPVDCCQMKAADAALSQRSPAEADPPHLPVLKRQRTEGSCEAVREASGSCGEPQEASTRSLAQNHGALAGARSLAAVMRLEAPARLTLQGVYDLLEASSILLAEPVIRSIPVYVEPALAKAPLLEVRIQHSQPGVLTSSACAIYINLSISRHRGLQACRCQTTGMLAAVYIATPHASH